MEADAEPSTPKSHPTLERSYSMTDVFFSQRIVSIDFYTAAPTPEFDPIDVLNYSVERQDVPRVPILRVYGATPRGQKTCTHVHGVFPYITILYDPDIDDFHVRVGEDVDRALNEVMHNVAAKVPARKGWEARRKHVFKTVVVSGRTYYGYRHNEEVFVRIYFFNPWVVKKAAELLLIGAVLNRKFQPYDAHIPFHLQFLIDFDLYGMNMVHYKDAKFRKSAGQEQQLSAVSSLKSITHSSGGSGSMTIWNLTQLPDSFFSAYLDRSTITELEIDVCAGDILVSGRRTDARSSNPGIDAIWQDEMLRRKQIIGEEYSQVSIPESQDRDYNGYEFSTEATYREILQQKLISSRGSGNSSQSSQDSINRASQQAVLVSEAANHFEASQKFTPENLDQSVALYSQENSDEDELDQLFKEFIEEKNALQPSEVPFHAVSPSDDREGTDAEEMDRDIMNLLVDEWDTSPGHVEANNWDQSFLSNSVVNSILANNEDPQQTISSTPKDPVSSSSKTNDRDFKIFQGDGLGGLSSDDSDNDEKPVDNPGPARRSIRVQSKTSDLKTVTNSSTAVSAAALSSLRPIGKDTERKYDRPCPKSKKKNPVPTGSNEKDLKRINISEEQLKDALMNKMVYVRLERLSALTVNPQPTSSKTTKSSKVNQEVPAQGRKSSAATPKSRTSEKSLRRGRPMRKRKLSTKSEKGSSTYVPINFTLKSVEQLKSETTPSKDATTTVTNNAHCSWTSSSTPFSPDHRRSVDVAVQTDSELICEQCGSCEIKLSQSNHVVEPIVPENTGLLQDDNIIDIERSNTSQEMPLKSPTLTPPGQCNGRLFSPSPPRSLSFSPKKTSPISPMKSPKHSKAKELIKRALHKLQSPSFSQENSQAFMDSDSWQTDDDNEDVSFFSMKRIASKSKSRTRRMKARAKKLEANLVAPDVFRYEFEPLKPAPSFKRLSKCRQGGEVRTPRPRVTKKARRKTQKPFEDEHSSQESSPEKITRRYNVGSSSDGESDSDKEITSSPTPITNNINTSVVTPQSTQSSQSQCSNETDTPRSILRFSNRSSRKCASARQLGIKGKRKIHWEEGSPKPYKRRRIDDGSTQPLPESERTSGGMDKSFMEHSELDGPSPKNKFGFEHDMSNLHDASALHQHQFLTVMSLEVHCETRENLHPDPDIDSILGIFICINNDCPEDYPRSREIIKCFLLGRTTPLPLINQEKGNCEFFSSELEMLQGFLKFYQDCDPDIIVGYETEKVSWGYIVKRGVHFGLDIISLLSRLKPVEKRWVPQNRQHDEWNGELSGRIVLNLWRLLRHEITVQSYTYENAAYHVLHRRVCRFSFKELTGFWKHPAERWRVLEYYAERTKGSVEIINSLDLINRTSELARLFGIMFYEVFSRGSQFRVESMMLRITRVQNLIPVSPSIAQRAQMKAPEFLPLILEPMSSYYTDPVVVLDFQSLYPSMMIAYNYDYSTVIGRVEHLGDTSRFPLGCVDNEISPALLKELQDSIHISPAGVAFVKQSVRKGVLSEMLEQILDTRQMVKRSMKKWKSEGASLQKVLDSRQLGLKLIANVTYGYTSANFSGRMPCVDIADSVVSKGRETLQRAIDYVKSNNDRWGGEVIYGDTDSLFVLFRGKPRAYAFKAGREIAEEITKLNPKPVKLKFEKVYQPCILQTKKRYVGYSYETEDQVQPIYDAKGIETVRRDGCPAVKKILEKSLHILFTTNDPEKVKSFVQLQFKKLFTGRVSMKDYMFAREYRGRDGYKPTACVPSLEIAKKILRKDPRAEPLKKQRVPYVIIYDKPTLPLIQLVRTPLEFANDCLLRLNAHYYIEKAIIPALKRCFSLAKIDVMQWYRNLPRKYLRNFVEETRVGGHGTLDDFIQHSNCPRCDRRTERGICLICDNEHQKLTSSLVQMSLDLSTKLDTATKICYLCSGDDDKCENTDCPVFHKLLRYERDEAYNRRLLEKLKSLEF